MEDFCFLLNLTIIFVDLFSCGSYRRLISVVFHNIKIVVRFTTAAVDMDMGGDSSMGFAPLSDAGMNMTNSTVAMDFLMELLDDSDFQPVDIALSCAFWYGIVLVIGIAAMINIACIATSKSRYVTVRGGNFEQSLMPSTQAASGCFKTIKASKSREHRD